MNTIYNMEAQVRFKLLPYETLSLGQLLPLVNSVLGAGRAPFYGDMNFEIEFHDGHRIQFNHNDFNVVPSAYLNEPNLTTMVLESERSSRNMRVKANIDFAKLYEAIPYHGTYAYNDSPAYKHFHLEFEDFNLFDVATDFFFTLNGVKYDKKADMAISKKIIPSEDHERLSGYYSKFDYALSLIINNELRFINAGTHKHHCQPPILINSPNVGTND